jgi:hypothetical protein
VMEENPSGVTDALVRFLGTGSSISALPQMRMTPVEVQANQTGSNQIGSSGLAGVSTKVLFGDPSSAGFYTIVLFVPAHTTIPAHSHRDDRMAAVVSGTWQFGYGDRFDEGVLKSLPVGSVYSEPGGTNHFERTGGEPETRVPHHFFAAAASFSAFRCGRSWSVSWHVDSYISNVSRWIGKAMVQGRA